MRVSYKVLAIVCLLLLVPAAIAESPSAPYRYTGRLSFDIAKVPFSRYGSYMAISEFTLGYLSHLGNANLQPGVYLRSVHGDQHAVFRMELLEGNSSIAFHAEASPSVLKLQSARGDVEICIPKPDELRFRGQRVSLRLTAVEDPLAVPNRDEHWEINSGRPIEKYMLWATQGHLHMDAPWNGTTTTHVISTFEPDASTGHVEGVIDTYPSVWKAHTVQYGFQTARKQVEQNYDRWLARMPDVPISLGAGAELAAYVNWTSVVEPDGFYARPAMLMSKNWMAAVWSWDHCFNAMASSFKDPEFAWQQFMLPFDVQQQDGSLPDMIKTSSKEMNFTKPPIHGWVLAWMMQHGGYQDNAHLAQIYEPLARWTDWYFQYRDTNANGLPEYNHGNDSGWDNSTAMLTGVPVETPDLDSFLVLQMDTLAKIAGKLGKDAERRKWQSRSDELLHRMLDTLWKEDHFVLLRASDGARGESDSLLLYLPVLLGKRLPDDVRLSLVKGLVREGKFHTAHGIATEPLTSKYYTPDGYWRGPIWAPTSMIVAEGLDASGEHALARKLREEFCQMAQKNGMYENYNAVTGEGLRDSAYTWASSVYLVFAHQLMSEAQ